jgi:hypothetical protein
MLHEWQIKFADHLRVAPAEAVPGDFDLLGVQAHRVSVYRDNVLGSLVEALGHTFPVTRQLVGERFFDAVAAGFVRQEPPTAPRLSRYGAMFPAHLQAIPQLQDMSYIADVAMLEWARVNAYFAGVAPETLSIEALLSQPQEFLPHLVFKTVPSLHVVTAPTAINSIWQAHQLAAPDLSSLDPWRGEAVRLLCTAQGVSAEMITPAQAIFLRQLQTGKELMAAAEMAVAADATFDLQATLVAELGAGSFSGIAVPTTVDIPQ